MNKRYEHVQSRPAKWGWGLLLVLAGLITLQGAGAYLASKNSAFLEQFFSVSMIELRESYPSAADAIVLQTANFGILAFILGLLALVVALKGLRHGSRWAWNAYWIVVGGLAVIEVNATVQSSSPDGLGLIVLALALVGQLLAGRGLPSKTVETGKVSVQN